jgi:ankyrin repeat protein
VGVVKELLRAHPEAAKTAGQAGLLPLHLAAGRNAGLAVVTALLKSYAAATGIASDDGDLPLHLAAGDAELKVCAVVSCCMPVSVGAH